MAKKKNAAALFEVISRTRKHGEPPLALPGWLRGAPPAGGSSAGVAAPASAGPAGGPAAGQRTAPPAGGPEVPAGVAPAAAPSVSPAGPAVPGLPAGAGGLPAAPVRRRVPAAFAVEEAARPIVLRIGPRFRLSLDYITGGAAMLAGALVLVLVFVLGWWGGSRPADRTAAQGDLRRAPYRPDVLGGVDLQGRGGGPASRMAPAPAAPDASGRIKGKHYLVIQGLPTASSADLEEAMRIVAFCKEHGEPAEVKRYRLRPTSPERYIVWSLVPFDSPSDEKARNHAMAIESLGKQYFEKYKTHKFSQRNSSGKFEPWFETYR